MKYIITSGPMEMAIDDVRKIKNSSTGSLGTAIANELRNANKEDVTYIHTSGAFKPENIKCIEVSTHSELITALTNEMTDDCCVIHAMAISDFRMEGSVSKDKLFKFLIDNKDAINNEEDIQQLIEQHINIQSKLSSKEDQVLFLSKEIKVIDQIKQINPNCMLVGFKLLSNVTCDELIRVARQTLERASCDLVVANLKEEVSSESHHGYLVTADNIIEAFTKQEIARQIINQMERK